MFKKVLAMAMVLTMVFSMVPATAFATETNTIPADDYASLAAAIAAAEEGDVITVLADIELTEALTIPADKTIVLELNGKTISQTKAQTAAYQMILNDGNLTIQDSVGGGKISYTDSGNGGSYISNTITNRGTLTLLSGTVENLSSSTVAYNGFPYAIDNSIWGPASEVVVNIKGGTVTCASYSSLRIFAQSTTEAITINISGGTINGRIEVQNPSNKTTDEFVGVLNVTGGVINKNNSSAAVMIFGDGSSAKGLDVNISGGSFTGAIGYSSYYPVVDFDENVITGGTFDTDVSNFCAEGFECKENSNGTFGVQIEGGVPELPSATITTIKNDNLTFAMNFKVNPVTQAQLAYYGNWYADFELVFNKTVVLNNDGSADGWLAGQYDDYGSDWLTVPYGKYAPVTLNANEPLKIMAFAAQLLGEPGLKYTYKEIYEVVRDFDCGMYLDNEFLAANPDLEVTLLLKMYNPADESESYIIGETYTFTNPSVAQNTTTNKVYATLSQALMDCAAGQTVILLKDVNETIIPVLENTTLDLNGYTLTASYVSSFGDIVDNSADNSGLLKVAVNRIMLREENAQLPVRDGDGYRFVQVQRIDTAYVAADKMFAFQVRFEPEMLALLLNGQESTGVTIQVKVSWKETNGYRSQNFIYIDEFVQTYLNSYNSSIDWYGEMFTLVLNSTDEFQDLTFTAVAVSETGVSFASAPYGV